MKLEEVNYAGSHGMDILISTKQSTDERSICFSMI
jgi:hypothetical protein